VQIQTGHTRNLEHNAGQDFAVGHYDNHLRLESANLFDGLRIFDSRRLKNRRALAATSRLWSRRANQCLFYRRRLDLLIATDRLVGLRDNADDFVFRVQQRVQRRQADFACTDKDDAHAHLINGRGGPPGRPSLRLARGGSDGTAIEVVGT
jgi:hypothetical protein